MLADCEKAAFWAHVLGRFPLRCTISIVNLCGSKFSCGHANGALVNLVSLNFLNRERQAGELCGRRRIAVGALEFGIAKSLKYQGPGALRMSFVCGSELPSEPNSGMQVRGAWLSKSLQLPVTSPKGAEP